MAWTIYHWIDLIISCLSYCVIILAISAVYPISFLGSIFQQELSSDHFFSFVFHLFAFFLSSVFTLSTLVPQLILHLSFSIISVVMRTSEHSKHSFRYFIRIRLHLPFTLLTLASTPKSLSLSKWSFSLMSMWLSVSIIVFPFSFTGLSEVVMECLLYIAALVVLIIAWYVYSSFYVFNPFDASSLVLIVLLFYV